MAIGSGWQGVVAYVNLATYYIIGLPIGCVLGFKTSLAAAVSNIMLSLSLSLSLRTNPISCCWLGSGDLVGDDNWSSRAEDNSSDSNSQNKLECGGNRPFNLI